MNIHVKPGTSDLKEIYEKFKKDEVCETFYETGELKERWTQKYGKLHGYYTSFFKSGNCQTKIDHKDGKENGLYESYYENGQLEASGVNKSGKHNGEWKKYYPSGALFFTVVFENDKDVKTNSEERFSSAFLILLLFRI